MSCLYEQKKDVTGIETQLKQFMDCQLNYILWEVSLVQDASANYTDSTVLSLKRELDYRIDQIIGVVNNLDAYVDQQLQALHSRITTEISTVNNSITSAVSGVLNTLDDAISGVTNLIGTKITETLTTVSGWINDVKSWVSSKIQEAVSGFEALVVNTKNYLLNVIGALETSLRNVIETAKVVLMGLIEVVKAALDLFINLISQYVIEPVISSLITLSKPNSEAEIDHLIQFGHVLKMFNSSVEVSTPDMIVPDSFIK